jgi:signal peptidase I
MSGAGRGVPPGAEPDESVASAAADHDQPPVGPDNPDDGSETSGPAAEGKPEDPAASGAAETSETPDSPASGPGHARRRRRKKRSFWREFPILVVVALLLAVVIKTYAIQAFFIPSGSMENTLEINDRVLVNKLVYDVRDIHRGDIVVFNGDGSWDPGTPPASTNFVAKFFDGFASMFGFGHPGDILIKRVIGLPGDHVACCNAQDQVTVNGVALSEQSYLYPGDAPSQARFNIVVQPGRLWVMGDHRLISDGARDHLGAPGGGRVPEEAVIGRAFVRSGRRAGGGSCRFRPPSSSRNSTRRARPQPGAPGRTSCSRLGSSRPGPLCRCRSASRRPSPSPGCSAEFGFGSPGIARAEAGLVS